MVILDTVMNFSSPLTFLDCTVPKEYNMAGYQLIVRDFDA